MIKNLNECFGFEFSFQERFIKVFCEISSAQLYSTSYGESDHC